jgi:hypothetical protein
MAKGLQLAAPVMRRRTGFDTDQAGLKAGKELQHLQATDAPADHRRAGGIDAVNLQYRLRNIETDRDNFAHRRLPHSGVLQRNTLWHSDASEWAPSTAS